MSFSGEAKSELCRAALQRQCCAGRKLMACCCFAIPFKGIRSALSQKTGLLQPGSPSCSTKPSGLRLHRMPEGGEEGAKLTFEISERDKLADIVNVCGFSMEQNLSLHINFGLLEEDCCRVSFLRGVFLAGGSVTDPAKRYHMEFVTSHYKVSRELEALLIDMGFVSRETTRGGNFVTYFKQSEHIEDLLTLLGAPVAAMDIMSAKVEKNLRNEMNRRVNCDTANVTKAVDAAQEQLAASGGWKRQAGWTRFPGS